MVENEIYRYDIVVGVNDDEAVRRAQVAEERLLKIFKKIEKQASTLSGVKISPYVQMKGNFPQEAQVVQEKMERLDRAIARPEALLDDRRVSEGVSRTTGKLKDLTSRAWRVSLSVKDGASAVLGRIAGAITSPLAMLGAGVGGAAAIAYPLKLAGEMEQANVAMETMLGSSEKAKNFLGDLAEFAINTPFEMTQLRGASRRLLAFGFDSQKVIPMLNSLGNAASGLGLGEEGLNRMVLAIGQMKAKAKVSGDEMLQLTEAGVPAWDILAKSMGKSTAEVMKLSEKGLIPAGQAIDALLKGMDEKFPEMMEKQSRTLFGLLSTIKDYANLKFFTAFGEGIRQAAVPALQRFVDMLNKNDGGLQKVQERLTELGRTVGTWVVDKFERLYKFFEKLSNNQAFQKMDWGDKIIYVLDQMMDAMDKWVAGDGGKQVEKVFIKLAEIATKAWLTALGGMAKGSADALLRGNITGAAGLAMGAGLLGGGMVLRGGLGVGKAILKGGKWVASRGGSSKAATVVDAVGVTPGSAVVKGTERIVSAGKVAQAAEGAAVKATGVTAAIPAGYKSAGGRFWQNIDLARIESRDKIVSLQNNGRLQQYNTLEKAFSKLPGPGGGLVRAKEFGQKALQGVGVAKEALAAKLGDVRGRIGLERPLARGSNSAVSTVGATIPSGVATKTAPAAAEAASGMAKAGKVFSGISKVASKAALPFALAVEAYGIAKAEDKAKATAQAGGGLAGAWAGGAAGAKIGAAIGTFIAPGIGTAIGGMLGGITGSVGGYAAGKWAAGKIVEKPAAAEASEGLAKTGKAVSEQQERIAQTGRVYMNSQGDIITSNGFVVNSQNDLMQAFTTLAQAVDFASAKLIAFSGIERQVPTSDSVSRDVGATTMVAAHASGGIMTRPHLGLVAEAGPEAIIPLSPARRGRALDLWQQAGVILGVAAHADGGFFGAVKRFFSNDKVQNAGNYAQNTALGLESSRKGQEVAVKHIYSNYDKRISKTNTIAEATKERNIAHQAMNLARRYGKVTKTLSRIALPLAIFSSIADIIASKDKKRAVSKEFGSVLGGVAAGALTGAAMGSLVGAGVLSPLTAMIGGIIGAGFGMWGGGRLADSLYGKAHKMFEPIWHANGGMVDRPHLGMVGEAGPEAIIPLSPARRGRALDLWQQVGEQLGIRPYAFGGFAGPMPVLADGDEFKPYDNVAPAVPIKNLEDTGRDVYVAVSGVNINISNEMDFDELATEIGWRIVGPIKKVLENKS